MPIFRLGPRKKELSRMTPDMGPYSRRGKLCISGYSPLAATPKTGQETSRLGKFRGPYGKQSARTLAGAVFYHWRFNESFINYSYEKHGSTIFSDNADEE
jgi:hypothetical protein